MKSSLVATFTSGLRSVLVTTTSYVSGPAKQEFADVIPWELEFKEYEDLKLWLAKLSNDEDSSDEA